MKLHTPSAPALQPTALIATLCLALAACTGSGGGVADDTSGGRASSSLTTNTSGSNNGSTAANTAGNASASQGPLQPGEEGYTLTSAEFQRLYGPGVYRQDGLGNTVVGINKGQEQVVSNRFRATVNGNLSSVRLYWQTGNGYSSGNHGSIRLRLLPDDGSPQHLPDLNATPLAESVFTPGTPVEYGRPLFADVYFGGASPCRPASSITW